MSLFQTMVQQVTLKSWQQTYVEENPRKLSPAAEKFAKRLEIVVSSLLERDRSNEELRLIVERVTGKPCTIDNIYTTIQAMKEKRMRLECRQVKQGETRYKVWSLKNA